MVFSGRFFYLMDMAIQNELAYHGHSTQTPLNGTESTVEWLYTHDGEVTPEMTKAGIRGWVVDMKSAVSGVPLDSLRESSAIPLRPGVTTELEEDLAAKRRAEEQLAQWTHDWGNVPTICVLVPDEQQQTGFLLAPVPAWMLWGTISNKYIQDRYYHYTEEESSLAHTFRAAFIIKTGRLPSINSINHQ